MKQMFDDIEARYDLLNHLFSFGLDFCWRRAMVRELLPVRGPLVLDLASGTGDSAVELTTRGYTVIGLDVSMNMLLRARQKIGWGNYGVVAGSAYALPFGGETFDGVTCAFGIRNMHQTTAALKEVHRVLKSHGKAVFLEFSMPQAVVQPAYILYLRRIIPAVARVLSRREAYEYLGKSIESFHRPETLCQLILDAGFIECEKFPLTMGVVHIHKAVKG